MNATLRYALESCLADAASRAALTVTLAEHASVEGAYLTLTRPDDAAPLVIATAVDPTQSPFDEIVRDRARSVAARLGAQWILVTSFRTMVVYNADRITRRLAPEEMVLMHTRGADVLAEDELMVSAHRVATTDSLRRCLLALTDQSHTDHKRAPYLISRVTALLEEMLDCTDRSDPQVTAVERLGTSVVGYALLALRYPEDVQAMQIPYGSRSSNLTLDLIGAYLREANRLGHHVFPDAVSEFQIDPTRLAVFTSAVADLVRLVDSIRLDRFKPAEIHHTVDALLLWCARIRRLPVPTIDAIDLAIMASHLSDLPHHAEPRILEIGSTIGMLGVRARLMLPHAYTAVFAATDMEERQLLLRASGQPDERREAQVLRSLSEATEPWNLVCLAFTRAADPYLLQTLLSTIPIADDGTVVLYVSLSVLRDAAFAEFRLFLVSTFDVRWVFTADAEPLAEPDNGTCCVILKPLVEGGLPDATNFGFIRSPISSLVPPAVSLRSFSLDRAERFRVFLRYLVSSERGKINQEVVVRRVARSSLLMRACDADAGWDDFVVPPDVIASILQRLSGRLQRLVDCGDVFSGLRTGANDVFAPDIAEISRLEIEEQYWQRTTAEDTVIDNTVITSGDDIVSIGGLPNADRRLLLMPADRKAFEQSNAYTHVQRAERDGVHSRPSVRTRDPWWHLGEPPTPDLIIPKQQHDRWLIATNPTKAFITDSCIGVQLTDPRHATALALWMNSSLALFLSELVQSTAHVADVTVRDAKEFPVPNNDLLNAIDPTAFRDFVHRRQHSVAQEFGTDESDVVRPSSVQRDRRRLDRQIMGELLGMTDEEQRWIYRFALAWRGSASNLRHLANALATQVSMKQRLEPMWQWYAPRIEQLPEGASRSFVLPTHITRAEHARSMFTHQVTLYKGQKRDDVIDCSSANEAELIATLVNLGKRNIEIPTDEPLLRELLPIVNEFQQRLLEAVEASVAVVPSDIREAVRQHMIAVMVS